MPISMSRAQQVGPRDKSKKLNVGRHIVKCLNMKRKVGRTAGEGFILEFMVHSGPTDVGIKDDFVVFPGQEQARGGLSKQDVEDRANGKIQAAVAAVAGWGPEGSHNVTDEYFARAVSQTPVSPLAGQFFVVECEDYIPKTSPKIKMKPGTQVPDLNEKGEVQYETTKIYKIFPLSDADRATLGGTPATPAAPPPPPAAPSKVTPESLGWTLHSATVGSENPYFFNPANPSQGHYLTDPAAPWNAKAA